MKPLLTRALLTVALLLCLPASAEVSVLIRIAPPPLPLYAQPMVPGEGYLWTPGYWAWSPPEGAYYWVPGTWVLAPNAGDLWTPGYWAFEGAGYFWHGGYWGRSVGFYGGLNYGYGYTGSGYQGGRWERGVFRYNRTASHVDARVVHGVYAAPVANAQRAGHASFNGGQAGVAARPTVNERRFQAAEHAGPSSAQLQHEQQAVQTPSQRATGPHGVPQVAATPRPSAFDVPGVEPTRPGREQRYLQGHERAERPSPDGHPDARQEGRQEGRPEGPRRER
jgi:hypothetical protein